MRLVLRVLGWIVGGIVALALIAVIGAYGYFKWRQHENAVPLAINTPNGIDEAGFVKIGGVDQWGQIRGEDRNNPVILMVSGGPGNALWPLRYHIMQPWEKTFTVVDWDQRGSGLTYSHDGGDAETGLTLPRMTQDGIEVAQYLRAHLHRKKIALFGWSWGTILGMEMIHARPDLFSVYVGTGQFVDGKDNESLGYQALLARAIAKHDTATVDGLRKIGPPPYNSSDKFGTERGLLKAYVPAADHAINDNALSIMGFTPGYSLSEIYQALMKAPDFSLDKLEPTVANYSLDHLGKKFDVPIIIIDGADDIQVPMTLAKSYFATLQAPLNEFYTIPGAAHLAPVAKPEEFLAIMNAKVRPVALAAQ
jgi:pimeloyl-ACP methyl ester carboxylesterase